MAHAESPVVSARNTGKRERSESSGTSSLSSAAQKGQSLQLAQHEQKKKRSRLDLTMSSSPASRHEESKKHAQNSTNSTDSAPPPCPQDYVEHLLKSRGFDATSRPASSLTGFFEEPTNEQIQAYDTRVVTAVRDEDLETLRSIHESGKTLRCCNRFGESLIHMACRRGFTHVAKFLIGEASVSIRIKDDYGRTPLHDACWSSQPRFELVELLLQRDPDLLLIGDARGFLPLQYIRKENWDQWIEFLSERKDLIRLKQFNLSTATCA